MSMVLIEYTENHDSCAGRSDEDHAKSVISAGTRRRVDAASAKSLVDKKKVAKYVTDDKSEKVAKAATSAKPAEGAGPN